MAVFLGLLEGGVLSEERLGYRLEIMERARRQRVEPIRCHTFQTEGKSDAQEWVIAGIDHYPISKMPDVPDEVAHPGVVVKSWS